MFSLKREWEGGRLHKLYIGEGEVADIVQARGHVREECGVMHKCVAAQCRRRVATFGPTT